MYKLFIQEIIRTRPIQNNIKKKRSEESQTTTVNLYPVIGIAEVINQMDRMDGNRNQNWRIFQLLSYNDIIIKALLWIKAFIFFAIHHYYMSRILLSIGAGAWMSDYRYRDSFMPWK